ncbi:MAG: FHA domain-containing protein [Candidatus Competibacteraceae bacterium]
MTPNGLMLRDLNSTNGTFINDVRITEAYIPRTPNVGSVTPGC